MFTKYYFCHNGFLVKTQFIKRSSYESKIKKQASQIGSKFIGKQKIIEARS